MTQAALPGSGALPRSDALPRSALAAVYTSRGRVSLEQRPLGPLDAGQVAVEVSHCGICGSDLHLIDEGWGRPGDVFGHEWSGTVRAVGAGVEGLAPGDRVIGVESPRCGQCPACLAGRPSQCEHRDAVTGHFDGAFATHVVADAAAVLPIPEGLGLREAALAEPLAISLHALTRSGIEAGQDAMVLGAGPLGALIAALLIGDGHRVAVVEPAERRAELARRLGAVEVRHPDELPTFDMAQVDVLAPDPVDVAFECSGRVSAMEAGFQQLRRGGRLVLLGTGMERPSFDPNRMIVLELSVCGSFVYDTGGFQRALDLLASGALPTDVLIDDTEYGLDGVAVAAGRLARGEHAGKVMVVPSLTRVDP